MPFRTATPTLGATLVAGLIAGYAGVQAKGLAEGVLQPQAEKIWPPTQAEKKEPGADPSDQPEKMPPAVIASTVTEKVTGESPDEDTRDKSAAVLHWTMGLGSALAYALLRRRWPGLRVGLGAPAGLVLYAATHGSVIPAAQVQPPPWKMPTAAVAWEAGSHVVYGMTVELGLRGLTAMAKGL